MINLIRSPKLFFKALRQKTTKKTFLSPFPEQENVIIFSGPVCIDVFEFFNEKYCNIFVFVKKNCFILLISSLRSDGNATVRLSGCRSSWSEPVFVSRLLFRIAVLLYQYIIKIKSNLSLLSRSVYNKFAGPISASLLLQTTQLLSKLFAAITNRWQ